MLPGMLGKSRSCGLIEDVHKGRGKKTPRFGHLTSIRIRTEGQQDRAFEKNKRGKN